MGPFLAPLLGMVANDKGPGTNAGQITQAQNQQTFQPVAPVDSNIVPAAQDVVGQGQGGIPGLGGGAPLSDGAVGIPGLQGGTALQDGAVVDPVAGGTEAAPSEGGGAAGGALLSGLLSAAASDPGPTKAAPAALPQQSTQPFGQGSNLFQQLKSISDEDEKKRRF